MSACLSHYNSLNLFNSWHSNLPGSNHDNLVNMADRIKKHESIGCCGIDCGLCPRFHAKGPSACPGCGGSNFREKHPACGFLSCCALKHGLEVCAECPEYPCKRFDAEKHGYDSFVTHRNIFPNHNLIRANSLDTFLEKQKIRMDILVDLLKQHDDGRSKSYFCMGFALLPLDTLLALNKSIQEAPLHPDLKIRNRHVRKLFSDSAESLNIKLSLNTKQGKG